MNQIIRKTSQYLSLVTFAHTIFAMPFAIIGFFIATEVHGYPFKWSMLLLVVLAMVFARNTAMGFNRWADRKFDARNPRTARREIPAGIISAHGGLTFTLVNAVLFIATTWFINDLCFWLSPVALLVVMGYSLTKRFTALCHLILGIGLSLAPLGAYLAVSAEFHWLPVIFSLVVLTWVSGFDIIYALQDEEFDRSHDLFSIPVFLGKKKALVFSVFLHILSAALVIWAGQRGGFGLLYYLGALVFILLLGYQHTIVSASDLSRVNRAFGSTNGVASLLFAGFVLMDLFF